LAGRVGRVRDASPYRTRSEPEVNDRFATTLS
jgi:hypothetical protein